MSYYLNLRTWAPKTSFKASEPWEYPKKRQSYDVVGADKSSFPAPPRLSKKPIDRSKSALKNIKYLSGDPGTAYSDKYRMKNIGEVRTIGTKTSNVN